MEAELEAGDDAEIELGKLKKAVEDLHKATNPHLNVPETITVSWEVPDTTQKPLPSIDYKAIERLEKIIDDSTTIEELANYKEDATKYGMMNQYMNKLKSLQ